MENAANKQLFTIGSCYTGAHDHLAVIGVHPGHQRLIGVDVLDTDDLEKERGNRLR